MDRPLTIRLLIQLLGLYACGKLVVSLVAFVWRFYLQDPLVDLLQGMRARFVCWRQGHTGSAAMVSDQRIRDAMAHAPTLREFVERCDRCHQVTRRISVPSLPSEQVTQ